MNLVAALLGAAATTPERPALVGTGDPVSHGEVAARSARATSLLAARVAPGDRVALLAGNEPAFVTAYLATLAAGAVAVPLNPTAPARSSRASWRSSSPRSWSRHPSTPTSRGACTTRLETGPSLLVLDAEASESAEAARATWRAPRATSRCCCSPRARPGAPKPAMLTHGSLLANLEQMQAHPGLRVDADDVALGVLPFFHVFGLNVVLGLALLAGAAVSLVDHFHPAETLDRVRADGVTVVAAVPAIFDAWLALDDDAAPRDAFARVRLCVSGAARARRRRSSAAMRERFGVDGARRLRPHRGVAGRDDERGRRRSRAPGSIGPPLPGVEVRLVDADGHDVLEGDPGEILVRGPNVFAGYWDDPDATARVLTPTAGCTPATSASPTTTAGSTLVDRAKDVIIVSGFNVYPGRGRGRARAVTPTSPTSR